jgi:hypothetical protein
VEGGKSRLGPNWRETQPRNDLLLPVTNPSNSFLAFPGGKDDNSPPSGVEVKTREAIHHVTIRLSKQRGVISVRGAQECSQNTNITRSKQIIDRSRFVTRTTPWRRFVAVTQVLRISI